MQECVDMLAEANKILRSGQYFMAGRCMLGFLIQLVDFSERRIFNHCEILDEIAYLEGITHHTHTKYGKGKQFTKEPLKGLYHKHFSTAMHIPSNIAIGSGLMFGKSPNAHSKRMNDIFKEHDGETFNDEIAWKLTNAIVDKTLEDRRGKFTGDWIIFEKDKHGINTYLTIAFHDEPDQVIYDRIEKYRKDQADIITLCNNWELLNEPMTITQR